MPDDRVARVYAAALFAAAQDAGRTPQVHADLGQFDAALAASSALRGAMLDPQVERAGKQRVLADLTAGADQLVVNALRLMLQRGRIALVTGVYAEYERLAAEAAREVDVEVTSAVELNEPAERELVERVERATGRRVRLAKKVDENVIGGLVLRVGDVVLDASLRARVEQLRAHIQHAEMRGGA
jgi:F-type H+-transporting ATPase subunit delta